MRIVIDKAARTLRATSAGGAVREIRAVLGKNAGVDKRIEGDAATPVGEFYVCAKNPRSKFFLSLCLSYPSKAHAERGLAAGLIDRLQHRQILEAIDAGRMPPQHTRLGGEIYIHGHEVGKPLPLSTRGCIAIDNAAMRDLYAAADIGTPVLILTGAEPSSSGETRV